VNFAFGGGGPEGRLSAAVGHDHGEMRGGEGLGMKRAKPVDTPAWMSRGGPVVQQTYKDHLVRLVARWGVAQFRIECPTDGAKLKSYSRRSLGEYGRWMCGFDWAFGTMVSVPDTITVDARPVIANRHCSQFGGSRVFGHRGKHRADHWCMVPARSRVGVSDNNNRHMRRTRR